MQDQTQNRNEDQHQSEQWTELELVPSLNLAAMMGNRTGWAPLRSTSRKEILQRAGELVKKKNIRAQGITRRCWDDRTGRAEESWPADAFALLRKSVRKGTDENQIRSGSKTRLEEFCSGKNEQSWHPGERSANQSKKRKFSAGKILGGRLRPDEIGNR
jgi:hypothetical protein